MKKEQEVGIFKPLYVLDHTPINAYFSKNSDDFVVREIPLYEFSGNGEHLILNIGKKDLTTYEALRILSEISGAKMRDFGYAGLKDKEGFTTQFISMPRKFEENLKNFSHEKLKILNTTTHNNKLRIGHLKGNAFFLRLKKVDSVNAFKIQEAFLNIDKIGFANYFGYQRFGKFGDNAKQGEDILKNKLKIKNPKIKDFLISAYQSELFNKWLSKRVEISKFIRDFSPKEIKEIYKFSDLDIKKLKNQDSFFKILSGDVLGHYPFGKLFLCENLEDEINRFKNRDTTVCGLLVGKKSFRSINLAKNLEDEIYKNAYEYENLMSGGRRFAWSYLKNANLKYNPQTAQVNLSFELDKGSYATVILEEILHKNIFD
ncbi:tRNA pseudouridine(13) synthase TruD [Campylobacter portucalensis]|uniref:tRNA pseudouridine(13) synthase TruD n=1 Tax=Campylobacter portucalensis TaxID=2608384 RepID=UPI002DD96B32|nr:tRNA pseudouridine(13) synthase TruD [Campylobacter portucalensis]